MVQLALRRLIDKALPELFQLRTAIISDPQKFSPSPWLDTTGKDPNNVVLINILYVYNKDSTMLPFPQLFNTSIAPEKIIEGSYRSQPFSISNRMYPGYCVADGEMYILDGWDRFGFNSFLKYTPSTNTVSTLPVNNSTMFASTMCYYDGKIYVHHSTATKYIFDIATNSWSSKEATGFTGLTRQYCSSASIDNIMYIHGGYTSSTAFSNRFYSYNMLTNEWKELAASPIITTDGLENAQSSMVSYNNMIYLCSRNGLHKYNPTTNTWSTVNNTSIYGRMCINKDLLCVQNVSNTNSFMVYDFELNTWEHRGTFSAKIFYCAFMTASNTSNEILCFGGSVDTYTGPATGTIYKIT